MSFLIPLVFLVGTVCVVELALTVGAIKRLRTAERAVVRPLIGAGAARPRPPRGAPPGRG